LHGLGLRENSLRCVAFRGYVGGWTGLGERDFFFFPTSWNSTRLFVSRSPVVNPVRTSLSHFEKTGGPGSRIALGEQPRCLS
jgi:hypothetical protein